VTYEKRPGNKVYDIISNVELYVGKDFALDNKGLYVVHSHDADTPFEKIAFPYLVKLWPYLRVPESPNTTRQTIIVLWTVIQVICEYWAPR
jgi:hypothetical protein